MAEMKVTITRTLVEEEEPPKPPPPKFSTFELIFMGVLLLCAIFCLGIATAIGIQEYEKKQKMVNFPAHMVP